MLQGSLRQQGKKGCPKRVTIREDVLVCTFRMDTCPSSLPVNFSSERTRFEPNPASQKYRRVGRARGRSQQGQRPAQAKQAGGAQQQTPSSKGGKVPGTASALDLLLSCRAWACAMGSALESVADRMDNRVLAAHESFDRWLE
eukprot:5374660-Amphidinium_carterae.1